MEGKRPVYAYAGNAGTGETPCVEIARNSAENIRFLTGRIVLSFFWEEDRDSLKEIQRISVLHALIYTGIVTVFLFALAGPLAHLFLKSGDHSALRRSRECICVACFSLPFHAIIYNFNNYLMAVKKIRFCCLYSFLIECGSLVAITFPMHHLIGYNGA